MLNILLPLAGSSELFANAGYIYPKMLIEIAGKAMIESVLENPLKIKGGYRFIFILKEEDCHKYHADNVLKLLTDNPTLIILKQPTKGALCSILMAIDQIPSDEELLVLNGDQVITMDFNEPLNHFRDMNADAGIVTFQSVHPRWSFARIEDEMVVETAEKNPISRNAIAGFYYFKNTSDFFRLGFQTIRKNANLDGAFFTSAVLNEYILENATVRNFNISDGHYHSFYSPQMVNEYEHQIHNH